LQRGESRRVCWKIGVEVRVVVGDEELKLTCWKMTLIVL